MQPVPPGREHLESVWECVWGGCGHFLEQCRHSRHRRGQADPVVCPIENGEIQPQEDIPQDPESRVAQGVIKVAVAGVKEALREEKTQPEPWPATGFGV